MPVIEVSETFIGSHEHSFPGKSKNGYGVNGDPNASSLMPGQSKPNIPSVSPPTPTVSKANATYDDHRLAEINGHPIAAHSAMAGRAHNSGSPSGGLPSANVRRSKTDGVGRPTK